MIIVMHDNGLEDITAKMDGAMHNLTLGNEDIVIGGIGNEFNITYSASSLNVSIAKGLAVACGRYFYSDESAEKTIPANTNYYLMAKIDLSQAAGSEGSFSTGATPQTSNLNNNGTVYEMPLYHITTNGNGVTSVVDLRKIKTTIGVQQSAVDNLQSQITTIQNNLGDQADFVLSGTNLTIVLH